MDMNKELNESQYDFLLEEIRMLKNRVSLLETTLQIIRMEGSQSEPTIFGPSEHNPPGRGDLDFIPEVTYPKPFMETSKRKIEGKPYDLGKHARIKSIKKK